METKTTQVGTLLTMLRLLDKYDITHSKLNRKHGLNRMSLRTIQQGRDLPLAHNHYFKVLLGELETLRIKYQKLRDADRHHEIKEVMFSVMKQELLGA